MLHHQTAEQLPARAGSNILNLSAGLILPFINSHLTLVLLWYEQNDNKFEIRILFLGATFNTSLGVKCCKLVLLVAVSSGLPSEIVGN